MATLALASLVFNVTAKWGPRIPDFLMLLAGLVHFFISLFILTIVVYLAGVIVVGGRRALFTDAFIISLLGTIFSSIILLFFPSLIGLIISFIVWLALIKTFYETSWLGAIAVAIMIVIVNIVIFIFIYIFFKIALELFSLFWF